MGRAGVPAQSSTTAWRVPTAEGEDYNLWTIASIADIQASNNNYASHSTNGEQNDLYNYGFVIPDGALITVI